MNTTIHIKPRRLHLTAEQEKHLNAYTSSIKSPRITDNCFVPIVKKEPSIVSFVYTRKNILPKKMSKYVCDNALLHSHHKLVERWMQDEYYG